MGRVIVTEFITLDGVISDPDGRAGTPTGGWAFRYGPETVAGDKFRLGTALDGGVFLLGRATWELFTQIWPHRDDDFANWLNSVHKVVVSKSLTDLSAWKNSTLIDTGLVEYVRRERERQNVVLTGSTTVVRELQEHDLVDEYRLLTFPAIVGEGERLFAGGVASTDFRLVSADKAGAAVLSRYERVSS